MPLVPAKCPECGGNINIDPEQRLGVCEYCKQPFVVQEAIQNFNTTYNVTNNVTNNNEIKTDVVHIHNVENDIRADLQADYSVAKRRGCEESVFGKYSSAIEENSSNLELRLDFFKLFHSYISEGLSKLYDNNEFRETYVSETPYYKIHMSHICELNRLYDAIQVLNYDDETKRLTKEMMDEITNRCYQILITDWGEPFSWSNRGMEMSYISAVSIDMIREFLHYKNIPDFVKKQFYDVNFQKAIQNFNEGSLNRNADARFGYYYFHSTYDSYEGTTDYFFVHSDYCVTDGVQMQQLQEEMNERAKKRAIDFQKEQRRKIINSNIETARRKKRCPYCSSKLSYIGGKCEGPLYCNNVGKKIFSKDGSLLPGIEVNEEKYLW